MNQKEKEALVKRLTIGRINNFKKYGKVGGPGKGMTGTAPFGYYWLNGELKIDDEKANWVRSIYRWREEGLSYRKIADRLNENGVITNRGNPFCRQSVMIILKNEFYIGRGRYKSITFKNHHTRILY